MTLKQEPVACALAGEEQVGRRRRWEELCRRSLIELTRTADGVELRFDKEPSAGAELRSLVVLERDCCSFARWMVHEDDGQLALHVGAAPDAVAAVQALFMAGPAAPSARGA